MPDLTLDGYRGVSDEELRQILKKELRKLFGSNSRDPDEHPDDTPSKDENGASKLGQRMRGFSSG